MFSHFHNNKPIWFYQIAQHKVLEIIYKVERE